MIPLFLGVFSIPCIAIKIKKARKAKGVLYIPVKYHTFSELS